MKPIDDDTFEYEGSGGFTQSISGFGREVKATIGALREDLVDGQDGESVEFRLRWQVDELVRWCRALNRQAQTLRQATHEEPTP